MEDIGIKLHPIKKLQLWEAIKKEVFDKMDNNIITPERADEILGDIKPKIIEVNSPEQAKELYLALPQIYTELTLVTRKFEIQEAEALDKILTLLLDIFIEKEGLDFASELMEKMHNSSDQKELVRELEAKYPLEFQSCLKRFSQSFA